MTGEFRKHMDKLRDVVKERGIMTLPELQEFMDISPNYLAKAINSIPGIEYGKLRYRDEEKYVMMKSSPNFQAALIKLSKDRDEKYDYHYELYPEFEKLLPPRPEKPVSPP